VQEGFVLLLSSRGQDRQDAVGDYDKTVKLRYYKGQRSRRSTCIKCIKGLLKS
jgi:hypothetical protein